MSETHAYLVLASDIASAPIATELKVTSADTRHLVFDSFGIDEARELKVMSAERAFSGLEHHFIISTKSITHEAQNAVLKLFEDPPPHSIFYLIIPTEALLLPTLRSRLLRLESSKSTSKYLQKFQQSSYQERLEWIAEKSKKDPNALLELVREFGQEPNAATSIQAKSALLAANKYVYNRGAGKKMILEDLALSLPVKE